MNISLLLRHLLASILCTIVIMTTPLMPKTEVYFSPDDNVESILIARINNAQEKIHAAVFMFTNSTIADALIAAKKRGIDICIITDRSCIESKFGKIRDLAAHDIAISVFNPPSSANRYCTPIMHHKFALIDDIVWTGSFNWTKSATNINQENVIISTNKSVYDRYAAQFDELKSRTTDIKKSVIHRDFNMDDTDLTTFMERVYYFLGLLKEKLLW